MAAVLMALAPGANQWLSLRNALQQGCWEAVVALAGRFSAFLILIAATVAGLGALLLTSETAFAVVKWCGVGWGTCSSWADACSTTVSLPHPKPNRKDSGLSPCG